MRRTRLIAVGTALALSGAVVAGPASAAGGVGTTTVTASLLRAELGADGSLLSVRLLGDNAQATIDPKVSSPEAYSRLTALQVSSSALPAPLNNLSVPTPPIESRTPGGAGSVSSAALDLANPATGVTVPAALLSGVVSPATLTSAVDSDGSRAGLDGSLTNLAAVGGLVSAESAATKLGAVSSATKADASRVVGTEAITVLDLGALLDGIGVLIADLPVSTVTTILDGLGVPVGGLAAGDLGAYVDALNDAIDDMQALIDGETDPTAVITATVPPELPTTLTDLGLPATSVPVSGTTTVGEVQATIDDVQALLNSALGQAMTAIDALKLLEVEGVQIGATATAAPKLSDSVSAISATIGAVNVGGVSLPEVDLADTVAQVNAAAAEVNSLIGEALEAISPSLANLVNVQLFQRDADNGVGTVDGYNKAIAGMTGVVASVVPPADLASVVSGLAAGTGIADEILAGQGSVPAMSTVMSTLETALGSVQALAGGATLRVAELRSVANFVAAPGSDGPRELPRTGSNDTTALAVFGALLAALAVGIRRYAVAPARQD